MRKIFNTAFLLLFLLQGTQNAGAQGFPFLPHYVGGPQAILDAPDRTIVLLGTFQTAGFTIQKYDTLGNLIWSRLQWADTSAAAGVGTSPYPNNTLVATAMVVTNDSGYLLCCDSCWASELVSTPNFLLITKYDKNGNRLWTRYDSTGPNSSGWPALIRPIKNKTEFIVSDNFRVLKYDANGNLLAQSPSASDSSWVDAMDSYDDTTVITASQDLQYLSIKYDSLLQPDILETHNNLAKPQYMATTTDRTYIETGQIFQSWATQSSSISLEKHSNDGTLEWMKYYHIDTFGIGNHVLQSGNNYIISGTSEICENTDTPLSRCMGFSNAVLIKTDTAGNEIGTIYISSHVTATNDTAFGYTANRSVVLGNYLYTYGTRTLMLLRPDPFAGVWEEDLLGVSIVWRTNLDSFTTPLEVYRSPVERLDDIVVFPNPGVNEVMVQSMRGAKIWSVIATDMAGNAVQVMSNYSGDHAILQTATLRNGTYVLNVHTDYGVVHKKIVVAR